MKNQPLRWNEVTAIFGGGFDPPHLGHREAVRGLFQAPGIKQVLIIPTGQAAYKKSVVSAQHRLEMSRLNFSPTGEDPFYPNDIEISDIEIVRSRQHPTVPSYTYDTLLQLKPRYSQLAVVIGADQVSQLPTWHRFSELLDLCHWIFLERKPTGKQEATKIIEQWKLSGLIQVTATDRFWTGRSKKTGITLLPTDAGPFSSSQVREEIGRTGHPPQDALLPEVLGYLKINHLYGM